VLLGGARRARRMLLGRERSRGSTFPEGGRLNAEIAKDAEVGMELGLVRALVILFAGSAISAFQIRIGRARAAAAAIVGASAFAEASAVAKAMADKTADKFARPTPRRV
jgi:hypothetical protein